MARIALICTRDPRGPATGRIMVLRTIIRSCRDLGHELRMFVLDERAETSPHDPAYVFLGRAGLGAVLLNVLGDAWRGRRSLNECIYYSRDVEARLRVVVDAFQPDVVVADMIRTAQYAARLGCPWIFDLDDLLSQRYAQWASGGAITNILGYYQRYLPGVLPRLADVFCRPLLRFESALIRRREFALASAADACCLVNSREATTLSAALRRPVHWAPMAVSHQARHHPLPDTFDMVFTGSMQYWPNLECVRYFAEQVGPDLARRGVPSCLTVIGACTAEQRLALSGRHVRFLGYVDDLEAELRRHAVFLAPIRSATGIKTKVVEALMAGLVVVSTPAGVTGLDIVPSRHFLEWSDPGELAEHLRAIAAAPRRAARVAAEGQTYARANFAPEVLRERWRDLIGIALGSATEDAAA